MIRPPRLPEIEGRPGWEARWQLTLIEPIDDLPEYMAGSEPASKPRLNLVLSRAPTKADDALTAAQQFLEQTASVVPGLEIVTPPEAEIFNDGEPGAKVTVSFLATPDVRLRQVHLFRIDDGLLTQAVITIDDNRPEGDAEKLVDAALGFVPEGD